MRICLRILGQGPLYQGLAMLLLDTAEYVQHLVVLFHTAFVKLLITQDLVGWFFDGVEV